MRSNELPRLIHFVPCSASLRRLRNIGKPNQAVHATLDHRKECATLPLLDRGLGLVCWFDRVAGKPRPGNSPLWKPLKGVLESPCYHRELPLGLSRRVHRDAGGDESASQGAGGGCGSSVQVSAAEDCPAASGGPGGGRETKVGHVAARRGLRHDSHGRAWAAPARRE